MASVTTPLITLIHAPQPYTKPRNHPLLFLSGSISLTTPTWQESLIASLSDTPTPITILNPHRPDWDGSWRESLDFPPFVEQVNWELDGLENADVVAMYFGAHAKAPISLLELGITMGNVRRAGKKVVICCPEGYWKRGNVQIVAARAGVEVVGTVEELVVKVSGLVRELGDDRAMEKERQDIQKNLTVVNVVEVQAGSPQF